MFYRSQTGIYHSAPLDELRWLEHGFGTRQANPAEENLATLNQIHSATILCADGRAGRMGQGDALIAGRPGLRVGVRTADCLPILLADPDRRAVAAVHAGWRGTLLGVAGRAVEELALRFGCRPASLHAAIGPGIRSCCFELGPEVAVQFRDLFPERDDLDRKTRLDLEEANRRQLMAAGVEGMRIHGGAPCTFCRASEFHSWRRDGPAAGRMISAAGIRP